jgi:uncharacterized tellurite resistance protein B-like protein
MFDAISRFFQERLTPAEAGIDDAQRLRLATCVLLLEVAHADDEFSAEERGAIDGMVARRFNLDENEASELVAMADQERRSQDDLYRFSRLVDEGFNRPRKLAILELLWEVVYSDGVLEAHEDALMHKMGTLLGIRHEELMAVKVKVKNRRS